MLKNNSISENKNTIVSNVSWALIGKITNLLSTLLVGIFVARYLGPEQYGLMNYVISFVNLFLILATFGFDNIEVREEAKNQNEKEVIIGTTFCLRVILSALTFIIILSAAFFNEASSYTILLIAIYSLSVFMTPFEVIRNHFTSIVQNEYIVKVGILRTVISSFIKVGLLLIHAPLIWFIISLVFETVILVQGYCYVYSHEIGSIRLWKFNRVWAKRMLQQAFPLLLSGAAATVFLQIDQVMIGNMINKASVGFFSIASKFVEILIYLPTITIQTVSPILIRIKKQDEAAYKRQAQSFLNIVVWLSLIIAVAMSLFSYYAVTLTFGMAYVLAVAPLQMLSFKVVGVALNMVSGQILIIDEKQKYFVLRSLSGCILCVILNFIVIPVYGIIGVAFVAIFVQLMAGFLIHAFIPQYHYMFFMQLKTITSGWKDLVLLTRLIPQRIRK